MTSLDIDKINLDPYVMNNVNITGFRLIDPESWPVQQYLKKFPNSGEGKENYLYSENALVHDAVRVFAKALNDLDSLHDMNLEPMRESLILFAKLQLYHKHHKDLFCIFIFLILNTDTIKTSI